MARPQIQGLKYFPFDSNIFSDRKIKRLLRTFGTKGFTVYAFLLCEIYRDEGYFMEWDDDVAFDVSDAIVGTSEDLIKSVVNSCFDWKLFDKEIYDLHGVLTSSGIQKRYLKATTRRTVQVEKYLIIESVNEDNETKTGDIVTETQKNDSESTQSKVKKSKVKENTPLPPLEKKPSKRKKRVQPDALQFPFTSPDFLNAWNGLVQTPKWRKKEHSALQLALNKLSRYEEAFALELIDIAHTNGNQGIVYPNTDEQYQRWKKFKTKNPDGLDIGQKHNQSKNKRECNW